MDFSVTMSERERTVGNSLTETIEIPFSCGRAGVDGTNTAPSCEITRHGAAIYGSSEVSCDRGQQGFDGEDRRSNRLGEQRTLR